jgi:molecular chaperone GrpE
MPKKKEQPDSAQETTENGAEQVQEEPTEAQPVETPSAEEQPPEVDSLRQQLEEESTKASEYYDQWLRSVAELRNYKKRVQQEQQQLIREANAELVSHLLPVLDDFERAMTILPDEQLRQFTWIEGIQLIYQRLQSILRQHGLQAIEALGQTFDPYFHDGILYEQVPAEQDQIVLQELQRGYKFQERVLRPTLVKVGRAMDVVTEPEEPEEEEPAAPAEPQEQPDAAVDTE